MPRAGLDRQAVIDAACSLADRDGLDAVTLARLARDLKVKAPSLYNHVGGLADIQRELTLRGIREANARMSKAAVGLARKDALIALGRAYRQFALDHPGLYNASIRAVPGNDEELALASRDVLETVLAVLSGYGLEDEEALHATRGLRAIIQGFVSLESAGGFGMPIDTEESLVRLLSVFAEGLGRS